MKRWMHKIEVIVDKAIVPCLVLLLVIIVLELGFYHFVEEHHLSHYLEIADYFVIFIFVMDLIFKYLRVRHIPKFIRKYWLDILAVFPFFLVFRGFELLAGAFSTAVSESMQTVQAVVHEGLEVEKEGSKVAKEVGKIVREGAELEKEGAKIAKEASKLSRLERSAKFMRFLRPILRIPRFAKAVPKMIHFFEKPTGEHHWYEFMYKH